MCRRAATARCRTASRTVDPQARHGHTINHRGFDGYKGHIAVDPDTEVIAAATVTPAGAGDGQTAVELLADLLTTDTSTAQDTEPERAAVYGDSAYGIG